MSDEDAAVATEENSADADQEETVEALTLEQRAAWRGTVRITVTENLKIRLYASPYFLEGLGSTVLDDS